jgi:TolA-binding protein
MYGLPSPRHRTPWLAALPAALAGLAFAAPDAAAPAASRLDPTQAAAEFDAVSNEMKKLEARIEELEHAQASMIETIKKLQSATPPADPAELFEKGKNQHAAGNHEAAIDALSAYLKSSKPKQAEEATFLRGESLYETKQYQKAIGDYSKFPEKYTKSKKMPYVLMKIGQSFDALGMRDDAKAFYQELVEKFPKSPEAKKARKKIR